MLPHEVARAVDPPWHCMHDMMVINHHIDLAWGVQLPWQPYFWLIELMSAVVVARFEHKILR
jgi:hypothetical protein